MEGKLIDVSTGKLLEKFGAGNHKPGSGSASALQGMLSAQMLRTVIDLTNDPKRSKYYSPHLSELLKIKQEIEHRIYPQLEALFQEDSEQFDNVIKLREQRDKEKDVQLKNLLSRQAIEALKRATEIPLKIGEHCLELGDFAAFVFDNGFKSARGDSGVALNSAISGVACCLSIIKLNLISIALDDWTEEIRQYKRNILSRYNKLRTIADAELNVLEKESEESIIFHKSIAYFQSGNLAETVRSNSDIEEIVKRLQNTLWVHRKIIWKHGTPGNPLQILKPEVILKKVMNYSYKQANRLGIYEHNGDLFKIADLIDKNRKLVEVSSSFPAEVQLFTIAHELGHAILHKQTILHRDRPIDGSASSRKNLEEMQADKFATYFLMPGKLVKNLFFEIFKMPKFIINEATVLAIRESSMTALRQKCKNTRGLARLIAGVDYYAGKSFNPLAKIFGVSIETMAIRLEELGLVEF